MLENKALIKSNTRRHKLKNLVIPTELKRKDTSWHNLMKTNHIHRYT